MIKKLDINDIDNYCNLRVEMLLSDKSVSYDKEELIFQTKNYCKEYINKTLFIFGYIENNEIVSIAAYEILKRLPTPKINNINSDIAYVCSVYTKKEFRKKGHSKLLLNEIIKDANKRGLTRFKLSSHNEIAIKMYEKLGFKKDCGAMVKSS